MLLSEVREKNMQALKKQIRTYQALEKAIAAGVSLTDDIVNCGDGYLYYTSTAGMNVQTKAPLGEEFVCKMLGLTRISSHENCGDAVDADGHHYEFKNSFTNQKQSLNLRQVRPWQNIDYYYCFYINEEDLEKSVFFELTKQQMEEEVFTYGSPTHGTEEVNKENPVTEWSLTIPVYNDNNSNTKRWKERYLSLDLKKKILGRQEG